MQTSFACGQGFAPTPHAPIPTGDHPTERRPRRSRGRSGDQHGRLRSRGPHQRPAVRRGDPAPQAWGRKRRRVAPREPPSATTLQPPSRKSLLGQIWGLCGPIFPLPQRPLSRPVPDLTTVPIAGIPPSGRLRPRGRGKPLPCLCAVLWDRELSLWGACVPLWLGGGLVRRWLGGCYPVRPPPSQIAGYRPRGGLISDIGSLVKLRTASTRPSVATLPRHPLWPAASCPAPALALPWTVLALWQPVAPCRFSCPFPLAAPTCGSAR